jgi:23S rRNA (cytosine1962-C5)-methyltransferase
MRDGLVDAPVGRIVELLDDKGRALAWGIADHGPIAVRVLGRGAVPDRSMADFLRDRVSASDEVRHRLLPAQPDCWRVVNGPGDGLPGLIVDRYGEVAVLKLYSHGLVEHLDAVVQAVAALPWCASVLRRFGVARVDGEDGAKLLCGQAVPQELVVLEAGIQLLVRPWVGQKTGLFLDQRAHRTLVGRLAAGRRVANLFAYNGGFSIAAALGGLQRSSPLTLRQMPLMTPVRSSA